MWDTEGVDELGWKVVFRHDAKTAGGWPKGLWSAVLSPGEIANGSSVGTAAEYSLLDQLESFRRPR